jgi:hypothetical protein
MDEALKTERLEHLLAHTDLAGKVKLLREEQLEHHKRITEIDRIEAVERLCVDPSKEDRLIGDGK